MELWKRLPLVLLVSLGLLFLAIGCDDDDEDPPPPPPAGILSLDSTSLDFGEAINEMNTHVRNTGNAELSWEITTESTPYWIFVTPDSGTLQAGSSQQIKITVFRVGVGPGETIAALQFDTDNNDDSLTVSIDRTCTVGDNFDTGTAADWNATAANLAQGDGYILIDPNLQGEAARLMQNIAPTASSKISARLRHTNESVFYKQYGILIEDGTADNALYFTVYVDNDTNFTLEQRVNPDDFEVLAGGNSLELSTDPEIWNILRLELFQDGPILRARGYAGTSTTTLFDSVEVDDSLLDYVKMGIRSEEYTVHADWFCAK